MQEREREREREREEGEEASGDCDALMFCIVLLCVGQDNTRLQIY